MGTFTTFLSANLPCLLPKSLKLKNAVERNKPNKYTLIICNEIFFLYSLLLDCLSQPCITEQSELCFEHGARVGPDILCNWTIRFQAGQFPLDSRPVNFHWISQHIIASDIWYSDNPVSVFSYFDVSLANPTGNISLCCRCCWRRRGLHFQGSKGHAKT